MITQTKRYPPRWSVLTIGVAMGLALAAWAPVRAADEATEALSPSARDWSFSGPLGVFDRAALQRGYQLYREVCSACHSLEFIAFRNLADPGGPEFSEEAVKALAAEHSVQDGPDEFGEMFDRPGRLSDYLPSPYLNNNEARAANGGSLPPDLSVIIKARTNGPNYLYALLTGYEDPPADFELADMMNYNPYFSGRQIAMAPQLFEGIVEYSDGTEASVAQMAKDLVQFLTWTAEPKLEERKALAMPVLIYMLILTILLYASYKRIWRDVDHD
ncbi:MAG: cytochrome c1 [Alphaproteobacteria bacterium]|nr:MAG: cytochrome c1 [Alphaproteobacteria bacterium]